MCRSLCAFIQDFFRNSHRTAQVLFVLYVMVAYSTDYAIRKTA